ncbi:LptF/LptG family permease [Gammaproteobacteria bacterium]|nr:LptF/LptG family permease [Gammaproteobacteria bacterium]
MKIITRHWLKQLSLTVMLFIFGGWLFAIFLELTVKFIHFGIVQDWLKKCSYILLVSPRNLYQISPILGVIAIIYVTQQWSIRREWLAYEILGYQLKTGLGMILVGAIYFSFIMVLIGEVLSPKLTYFAKFQLYHDQHAIPTKQDIWIKQGHVFYYLGAFSDSWTRIEPMVAITFNQQWSLQSFLHAKQANFQDNQWHLAQVHQVMFHPYERRFDAKIPSFKTPLTPRAVQMADQAFEYLWLTELWQDRHAIYEQSAMVKQNMRIQVITRLIKPFFIILVMVLSGFQTLHLTRFYVVEYCWIMAMMLWYYAWDAFMALAGKWLLFSLAWPVFIFCGLCLAISCAVILRAKKISSGLRSS